MKSKIAFTAAVLLSLGSANAAQAPATATAAQPASATQTPNGSALATVGNVQVTLQQLQEPLIEAYGLNILLHVVQREIAKDEAARAGVKVSPQDLVQEREQTIERMFKESNEKELDKLYAARDRGETAEADSIAQQMKKDNAEAFEQFLKREHLSRAEFDLVTQTNAYLRKIAEPTLIGRISDDNLKEAFRTLYGETIKCRHIQCANIAEVQSAKAKLAGGQPFAKVAQELSRNPATGPRGGELPPFSREMQNLPQAFRNAAFALKEGEVSDIVQADGSFHLILLEKRIPPKAVKFEDVKESIRKDLYERALEATVKELRGQIGSQAAKALVINDPVLKQQWQERLDKRDATIKDREEIRKQMQLERERATSQPVLPDLDAAK